VDKVRTVSDTKREFYNYHTRPINSIYRRVVEELMVEMHLLSVNKDFKSNPIYSLGVVSSFDRFMQGYQPDKDKESIYVALCKSVGSNPQQYRQEADNIKDIARGLSVEELTSWLGSPTQNERATANVVELIAAIAKDSHFKYSRLFAIGIYSLLETIDPELLKEQEKRGEAIAKIAESLHLPSEKMQKDLDTHRSNLEKMDQILSALQDIVNADRKQREKRLQEQTETTTNNTEETTT
jgi:photosystem II biogenesis protein Psp29